jgi:predicted amidohydrolase YtcJ
VLGADRARLQYPFAGLVTAGAVLAMGSDWAVSTADPLQQMEVAITRVDPQHRSNRPFLPEQRLTLGSAMRGFTAGSAFVNHDPDGGVLQVGKRADLAILDRDVFATGTGDEPPGARIGDARVEYTVAAGRLVFTR